MLAHSGAAYSKAVERMRRTLVPVEAKVTSKRRFSVVGSRAEAPKPTGTRTGGGLFGALRGKRAS